MHSVATIPTLLVHLDPSSGLLSYKPDDMKGARWRGGFRDIGAVCNAADEVMPDRYHIEYVEQRQ
jgi:hypothetical protein